MDLFKIFRRCYICRKFGDLTYVKRYGIYSEDGNYAYHKKCVVEIASHPENHPHRMVDRALHVVECVAINEERDAEKQLDNKKKCKRLRAHFFWGEE